MGEKVMKTEAIEQEQEVAHPHPYMPASIRLFGNVRHQNTLTRVEQSFRCDVLISLSFIRFWMASGSQWYREVGGYNSRYEGRDTRDEHLMTATYLCTIMLRHAAQRISF